MGFLGHYKCALCGNDCRGLRWTIKNGKELCGQCHDRLEKEMPYDKWHRMTITQIREYFADKEMLDSFDIISIVSEINDAFDISINVNDLRPENFNSVDAILALITKLQEE